ncbi:MAG: Trk family potassium uptake protein [Clostridia bacterium]|nr:Trk family potassium uptake protein [Clostridia bacterium]
MNKTKRKLSSFQIIILGFAGVVLLGALLLMLPISSQSHTVTPFNEALFTSTSAVCVTGLIVHDTATYWSLFGQIIILIMIQIGGLGVITVAASLTMLSGKKINLMQRSTMQEAISAQNVGGIVRLTQFVLKATAVLEVSGMLLMLPAFCKDYGAKGIWMSLFHSVSSFCNAGFDIMGKPGAPYQSLTSYTANPLINTVIILLIIIGGIGFLTWEDICTNKLRVKRYRLQSKIILVTSGILIIIPAIFFFFADFAGLPAGKRILVSLFQAVAPRTAGFNTVDLTAMSEGSRGIMIVLMLIGGSPGSTAGGLKTTTFALLFINSFAVFRRREDPEAFGRRIEASAIKNTAAIITLYFTLFFGGAILLCTVENIPFDICLFETASAVGTVGLTLGITPGLGIFSQILLCVLMFLGRVGGLTLIYAALSGFDRKISKYPVEKITVG